MRPKEYIEWLEEENPVEEKPWEPGEDYPHRGQKLSNGTEHQENGEANIKRRKNGWGYFNPTAIGIIQNKWSTKIS
jgi:hypothetical protein